MISQNRQQKIMLTILALWLGMTIVVDFVSVPLAFKMMPSKEIAGKFGITVFSRFNWFELIFGIMTFVSAFTTRFEKKWIRRAYDVVAITLGALSISYFYYITPTIIELSTKMFSMTDPTALAQLQTEHDFFHKLYVRLDTFKILLLFTGIGFLFARSEET